MRICRLQDGLSAGIPNLLTTAIADHTMGISQKWIIHKAFNWINTLILLVVLIGQTLLIPIHKGYCSMIRLDWFEASPGAAKALGGLHHFVTTGTNLPPQLIHLVFLRASQINGCSHCIDIHSRDLIKGGMSVEKLVLVPVWHEAAHLFSDQERSALAWTEEVTLVSETHVSDEAYAAASSAFTPKDLVDLTAAIAAMNAFNRMGVSFRLSPAAKA